MANFDDVRLDKAPEATPPPPPQPRWVWIIAGAVLLLALVALWFYLRGGSGAETADIGSGTEQTVSREPLAPPLAGEPGADIALPPLNESDGLVRELVRALSEHPQIAAWLTTDQLIRNFTLSVMEVADGETPAGYLQTVAPDAKFQTRQQGAATYIDARSYTRFDGLASAVASIDARAAARLYATLKPRIQEAHRELAGPAADFDRTLQRAIVELLETPIIEGDAALERRTVGYGYRDPALDALSRAQQQLLRMGPENVRVVQEKLRAIAGHLGIDGSSLPRERVVRVAGDAERLTL